MTRTIDTGPAAAPNGEPRTISRAEAYARIARTLKLLSTDAERRQVLTSIAMLYEAP